MRTWAADQGKLQGTESFTRSNQIHQKPQLLDANPTLRQALLDFIADFANWDNSTVPAYLDTSRALTQAAHEALGGATGTRPLVVDPFAGGGSIPLEALRVGADAFASDLNPIPVLLNKVVLEYIPKYGQRLADEVRRWGEWIKREAEKELAEFYPKDPDGATPIAYLWARTIRCEGPACGADVPIITQPLIAQRKTTRFVLKCVPNSARHAIEVHLAEISKSTEMPQGTVKRSSVTCPLCGYTTPANNVRTQFGDRKGGVSDARLLAVTTNSPQRGKAYRDPTVADLALVEKAKARLAKLSTNEVLSIPNEPLPYLRSIFNIHLLGVSQWAQLFTPRQLLFLATFARLIRQKAQTASPDSLTEAALTCMGISLDKMADFHTSLTTWIHQGEKIGHTFGRQALGIIWDFAEANPLGDVSGSWDRCLSYILEVIESGQCLNNTGVAHQASATQHPLPDDSAAAFITDPPYYDAVPYADLADFFYVWLKRSIGELHRALFQGPSSPKEDEIVQLAERNTAYAYKTQENFERRMSDALAEGRRVTVPSGVGVIVFAHKTTQAWESMLQAVIAAGWTIVASWPIDTERQGRLRAMDSAALASSVHLVCRPRENPDGSVRANEIGDWRDVLSELPPRIHEWMPRLASEGVVGADAIFACLGPALEIFSRYNRVEKVNGDIAPLREYLEHVWAAVSNEALSMIFKDADAAGLEPDARLTAMWLWTLGTASPDTNGKVSAEEDAGDDTDAEDEEGEKPSTVSGFVLEFDAARKIAQGLGIHLDKSPSVVEVKGDKARLLPVAERTKYLFGKEAVDAPATKKKPKKKDTQLTLFEVIKEVDADVRDEKPELKAPPPGSTVLDRVHQAMILFAAGRGEALKRFLVEEGIGKDVRFWKLAQSLSALYPSGIDEKRWVDGVLARKKSLGL